MATLVNSKETIRKNFSKWAHLYDAYADIQRRAAEELIKDVPARAVESILEIGCGTGNYTRLLRDRFKDAGITASDISQEMIDAAARKLRGEEIELIVADADSLGAPGGFDLVTSNAVFQWVADLKNTIAVCKTSLKDGGTLTFSAFGPTTFCELGASVKDVLGKDARLSAESFPDKSAIETILSENFKEISIREEVIREGHGSLMELLNKIKYTGARGLGVDNKPLWNRGVLKKIEEAYLNKFGRIEASYQIFFCKGKR